MSSVIHFFCKLQNFLYVKSFSSVSIEYDSTGLGLCSNSPYIELHKMSNFLTSHHINFFFKAYGQVYQYLLIFLKCQMRLYVESVLQGRVIYMLHYIL